MYHYYSAADWIGRGVQLALFIAGFLLVLREWRTTNRHTANQAVVAERHVDAIAQHANSMDRLAAAINNYSAGEGDR